MRFIALTTRCHLLRSGTAARSQCALLPAQCLGRGFCGGEPQRRIPSPGLSARRRLRRARYTFLIGVIITSANGMRSSNANARVVARTKRNTRYRLTEVHLQSYRRGLKIIDDAEVVLTRKRFRLLILLATASASGATV